MSSVKDEYFGVYQAAIQLCRNEIRAPVHFCSQIPDHLPVEVDRSDALHIAAVGHLIAFLVEAIPSTTAVDDHLRIAHIGHALEHTCNFLTLGIQADFAVHVDGQSVLGSMNRLAQRLTLFHQEHQESDDIRDPVGKFGGRRIDHGFVFRAVKDLLAEIGVFNPGDVGITTENALSFLHQAPKPILKTECFFQIHCVHSFAFLLGYIIVAQMMLYCESRMV